MKRLKKPLEGLPQQINLEVFNDIPLLPKEMLFISHYCTNGFIGYQAAKSAGYKGSVVTLSARAGALLKRDNVQQAVKAFIDSVLKPFKDRLEYEVLDAYYKRATYKVTDFFDDNGHALPLSDIPKEWVCCIDGVEKRYFGKDASRTVVTYLLPNRDTALQMLYRFATGADESEKVAPSEARENLRKIFESGIREQKKETVSAEEEFKKLSTGKGRPEEIPGQKIHDIVRKARQP
jgi:hypothetical protein